MKRTEYELSCGHRVFLHSTAYEDREHLVLCAECSERQGIPGLTRFISRAIIGTTETSQENNMTTTEKTLEEKIFDQAVERAVENLVGKEGDTSYNRMNLMKRIEDEVADKVAEDFWKKHNADLLSALDIDTISQLAMLKLIEKIAGRF